MPIHEQLMPGDTNPPTILATETAARDLVTRLYGTTLPIVASLNNPGVIGQWVFFIGHPGLSKPVTVFQDGSVNGPEIEDHHTEIANHEAEEMRRDYLNREEH